MMELEAATRRFQLWFRGLRSLRRDLRTARWADDPAQLAKLVAGYVSHFADYCAARAELDPVWTLAAPWASPVERGAAHWLAGWRPTTLVHLLYTESGRRFEAQLPDLLLGVRSGNLGDLSPAQLAQIDELQRRTVAQEDELSREMARAELDPVWTLAAPWASPVERGAAHWLAGWRLTTLVHLLYTESGRRFEAQLPDLLLGVRSGNLGDLSPAQLAQIDELQRRTVAQEDELSREMARVQEGHGAVGAGGELVDVGGLVGRVGAVLAGADALRLRTMKRAVEILEPAQAAELLVAAADMEIGFREFGLKYDGVGAGGS